MPTGFLVDVRILLGGSATKGVYVYRGWHNLFEVTKV